jgi:hypothetical protein
MRYLGYRDSWENCYYSTYGRDAALRFGERAYCYHGEAYNVSNNRVVNPSDGVCRDWAKCKGLDSVERRPSKKTG